MGAVHLWLTAYNDQQESPTAAATSLSRAFTRQVFEGNRDDIRHRSLVREQELQSYGIGDLRQHIQHYRAFATSELKLGPGELRLLLGAQQNRRQEYNHPPPPTSPASLCA